MNTTDEIDRFKQHVASTDRFEKLDWLYESCSSTHMRNIFVVELVNWMGEENFNSFYKRHCRNWDISCPEAINE